MAQVDVSPCFKKLISQYDIVEFLLSLDPYLKLLMCKTTSN